VAFGTDFMLSPTSTRASPIKDHQVTNVPTILVCSHLEAICCGHSNCTWSERLVCIEGEVGVSWNRWSLGLALNALFTKIDRSNLDPKSAPARRLTMCVAGSNGIAGS